MVVLQQSPNDTKAYRHLMLENGLEVILIHRNEACNDEDSEDEDEEDESGSKKAAAALSVGIGSFREPEHVAGLAHYLEHMVFMGSEKYPDENEFEYFLSQHGGYSNGSTDCENTTYVFEVGPRYLQDALDRFAQFFISPLFRQEAMDRELCAIESEFTQAQQSDALRLEQLMCHTVDDPSHVFHRFAWGNTKSLKETPVQKGIVVRDEIKSFYQQFYSANLMKLVVQGYDTLDDLEQWVTTSFGPIPNHTITLPSIRGLPWKTNRLIQMKPINEVHRLSLSWATEPLLGRYQQQPDDYIAHLIGHESEGSILSILKQKGWAVDVEAGINVNDGYEFSTCTALFTISFKLTEPGLAHWREIVRMVFQYIVLLRKSDYPEWVFEELKAISEMGFRFLEDDNPIEYVEELASIMHERFEINRTDLLRHRVMTGAFDKTQVARLCDQLRPETVRIFILSSSYRPDELPLIEPWFETSYSETALDITEWQQLEVHPDLKLPMVNPFVPTDFTVLSVAVGSKPEMIQETPYTQLWYKPDEVFNVPKVNVSILLVTPVAATPKEAVLQTLFVRLANDACNEYSYYASLAELEYSFRVHDAGFMLTFAGFSDKLSVLADFIIQYIATYAFKEQRFDSAKEVLTRDYHNMNIKSLRKARYERLLLLRKHAFPLAQIQAALTEITYQDVIQIRSVIFPTLRISALVHGNATKQDAIGLMQMMEQYFFQNVRPMQLAEYRENRVMELPLNQSLLLARASEHEEQANAVVEVYYQIGEWNLRQHALVDLLEQIMEEPLFDTLRTKEQLGYTVSCSTRLTYGILGYTLTVQSAAYSVAYIQQCLDSFLVSFRQLLVDLTDQVFADHVAAVIEKNLEPDNTLLEETHRHWNEIETRRYLFDIHEQTATFLRTVTLADLLVEFDTWFDQQKRKLCIHVRAAKGNAAAMSTTTDGYDVTIPHTIEYKKSLECFPNLV